ncbi:helix-turn-helix domain-containing protein [Cedecea sp. NFIX57]|uniref:helix-turn-helix domain-containing protein n=1 Tax=Cedecea sp. NFIX57 TaxID=1566286 RepID=UPI001594E031|nr:helix-turn-helix transcriptional regulator [Cedecea sp. NFIX57]
MEKTGTNTKNRERFIVMQGINRFSERLKVAMNGMPNVTLAAKCGISESAVRSYLKGRSFPGIDKIQAIAEACDAPMTWLITGEAPTTDRIENALKYDNGMTHVISMMTDEQRGSLASAIVEHGVSGIMNALAGISSISEFSMLPENERARVLRLYDQIKKGAHPGFTEDELTSPHTKQQAG